MLLKKYLRSLYVIPESPASSKQTIVYAEVDSPALPDIALPYTLL